MGLGGAVYWHYKNGDPVLERQLCRELDIEPALARVLVNRGITSTAAAKRFLYPSISDLHPPEPMKGLPEALKRLEQALDRQEKIVIYGDYDVDGITATVLLYEVLRGLGATVFFYLPNRFEDGYGLHDDALKRFREEGFSLVITVDCGINAVPQLRYAREIGLDVIVTDHHEPLTPTLEAVAVLNPKQKDCLYPWSELSGVGVVFKLISALLQKHQVRKNPCSYLDLVALGTIADLVPLLGENRLLVKFGLEALTISKRPGLEELKEVSGLTGKKISSMQVSFALAPRLNAVGRLGGAEPAAKLLLARDRQEAEQLALQLELENKERRLLEQKIFEQAREMIEENRYAVGERVIVLAAGGWHTGVLGIVASRLVKLFYRPVVLIGIEEGQARGSARSIVGFNIIAALTECAALLERFGGHQQAAGITLLQENIQPLRKSLNTLAERWLQEEDLIPRLHLDGVLTPGEIKVEIGEQLALLEPFGVANPPPVFSSKDWEIISWHLVGQQKNHLKLKLRQGTSILDPIYFAVGDLAQQLSRYRRVKMAFTPEAGVWRAQNVLNLVLKDLDFCDQFSRGQTLLFDHRHQRSKIGYLRELIKDLETVPLVLVNTQQQIETIRNKLNINREVLFIHQGNLEPKLKQAAPFQEFICYDLPFQRQKIKKLFSSTFLARKGLKIYLLYGDSDYAANEQLLRAFLPRRQTIKSIYNLLSDYFQEIPVSKLWPLIKKRLSLPVTTYLWQQTMLIFKELHLLQYGDQEMPTLVIREIENWSQELAVSSSYIKACEMYADCRDYQQFLLQADADEILKHFDCS